MTTREYIKQMRREDPNIRATHIADLLQISKARVGKILAEEKLPTRISIPNYYACIVCGIDVERPINFCSPECREKHFYIYVNCVNGDGKIKMRRNMYERKIQKGEMSFHNHSCMFKYLWKTKPSEMGRAA